MRLGEERIKFGKILKYYFQVLLIVSVTEKGQVTIPKKVREYAGIHHGDELEFVIEEGEIKVRKKKEENPFSRWKGKMDTDKTTEEIMEELRGE
ncbi:MAG: AbrB/MazE/SpoVT family DNA-binding domain-containing protein [Candidatus Nanohaloarchaea archaeon]